jgi:hypothetical protein
MAFIALNIMPRKKTWCDTKFIEERGGKRKKTISQAGNDFGSCFNQIRN